MEEIGLLFSARQIRLAYHRLDRIPALSNTVCLPGSSRLPLHPINYCTLDKSLYCVRVLQGLTPTLNINANTASRLVLLRANIIILLVSRQRLEMQAVQIDKCLVLRENVTKF